MNPDDVVGSEIEAAVRVAYCRGIDHAVDMLTKMVGPLAETVDAQRLRAALNSVTATRRDIEVTDVYGEGGAITGTAIGHTVAVRGVVIGHHAVQKELFASAQQVVRSGELPVKWYQSHTHLK